MKKNLLSALFLMTFIWLPACLHQNVKPTPVLAPTEVRMLQVTFRGTTFDPAELYVCSGVDGGLSCVERTYFETQLQGQ